MHNHEGSYIPITANCQCFLFHESCSEISYPLVQISYPWVEIRYPLMKISYPLVQIQRCKNSATKKNIAL